ncbi:DUF4249 family protein [Runella slithyformis]|uniref:DUF4249 domain-containing protein n=1 Tax=Runella slithyformis (strain ATCC 29530 / DSM 19594 / LMG 11500 / NCIMB 11436 / LSU 4) TaxID=761193 RepID=A0A7U3ZH68_RUNSL|nr:DUF4249 family protein [Runella slithyformis]AEI47130.1 hypothetical protein Runsl_0687 [Runella slithyformis DSM 19594]
MKQLQYFFGLMASLWFASCDSGVETERISPDNLVAVSSLISPQDSVVRVYVYQGKALDELARSDAAIISDAQVTIEEGGILHSLVFDAKTNSYSISNQEIKIAASKRYNLQVTTKPGLVLKAACIVPPNPDMLLIKGWQEGNDYVFNLDWPTLDKVTFFTFRFELTDVIFKPQLGASSGPSLGFITGSNLFNNKDRPNKLFESKISNAFRAEKVALKTTFYSLESNAFNYLKTKDDAYSWSANTSGLIPNLREPQPVFSNIQGGVGIFGAYNQAITVTSIK